MRIFEKWSNVSIAKRLIINVLGAVILMNVFMLVVIGFSSSKQANTFANNYSVSLSEGIASNVQVYMEQALETTNTLANTLMALRFSTGVTREAIEMIFINVLTGNDEYLAVWTIWEPYAYDGKDDEYIDDPLYEESEGRFSLSYYLDNGSVAINWGTMEDYESHHYIVPKERKAKTILNPYYRNYTQNDADNIFITSVVTPIIVDGEFLGVVGLDLEMESMHDLIENVVLFESGTAVIISNDLQIAGHRNKELMGGNLSELMGANINTVERAIKSASHFSYENQNGNALLRNFIPVVFSDIAEAWSVMAEIPLHEINSSSRQLSILIILIGLAGVIVISIVVFMVANNITKPILKINKIVEDAASGKLNGNVGFDQRTDEIGQIAQGMKRLLSGLADTANFARKIGAGNYDEKHSKLSEDDELGEALLQMQNSLKQAREEELKRKADDEIRNWITQGQAQFADIARQNTDDVNELSYRIISNLVKYLKTNQGGLFLLNDENPSDKFLELTASYAFDRRKYQQKRIQIGEGLVGTCFVEKKSIYLEKVPQNYIRITSGLGDENPRALLIMPLKLNEEIYGVLELAAFQPFKKYEIEFIEKVSEIIASSISSLKTASNTRILLLKSQHQAEEMRAQEEEMRQNMEELSATQESMSEKEQESQRKINELNARIDELTNKGKN
jgi:methyl-accepting chemotaxis protein